RCSGTSSSPSWSETSVEPNPDRPRPGGSVRPTPGANPVRPRRAHTMQVTVSIHEAWFAPPEDLRRVLALLAGVEVPPPGPAARPVAAAHDPREDLEEPFDPERRAPARREPDRGDAWEPPADDDDQDAPTDGRQLLGWARKQQPDAMGILLSY